MLLLTLWQQFGKGVKGLCALVAEQDHNQAFSLKVEAVECPVSLSLITYEVVDCLVVSPMCRTESLWQPKSTGGVTALKHLFRCWQDVQRLWWDVCAANSADSFWWNEGKKNACHWMPLQMDSGHLWQLFRQWESLILHENHVYPNFRRFFMLLLKGHMV